MSASESKSRASVERDAVIRIELQGPVHDKVQIAQLFRSAYERLDRLSSPEVSRIEVVYREDFCVENSLGEEFAHAAREALAYQSALTFGRPIEAEVIGLGQIADPQTRALVREIHQAALPRRLPR